MPKKPKDEGIESSVKKSKAISGSDSLEKLQRQIIQLEKKNYALNEKLSQMSEKIFNLTAVSQACRIFISNHDIRSLSEVILSMIAERVEVSKSALLIYDEGGGYFSVVYSSGFADKRISKLRYKPEDNFLWQMIQNGEPFDVVDLHGKPRFADTFSLHGLERLESVLWIPLLVRDQVIGLITLDRREIVPSDMDFILNLVSIAAESLKVALERRQSEEARSDLEHRIHKLSILYEMGRTMNDVDDLTNLLVMILDRAIDAVGASRGSLMMLEGKDLSVKVVRGLDRSTEEKIINGEIECTKIPLGEGVAGRVAITGEPLLIDDTSTDERFLESDKSNVKTLLCIPLRVYEETIGVINMSNKKSEQVFTVEDLKLITSLADQAAIAIHNARIYNIAVSDDLTKLYIRRYLIQSLEAELRRSARYSHPLSLLMISVDNFRKINEEHGRDVGDLLLAEIARLLRRGTRTADMAARYAGEKFCIMLPETDAKGGYFIGERIRQEVEKMVFMYDDVDIRSTVSIGVATYPDDCKDVQELARRADLALYRAIKESGNCCKNFSGDHKSAEKKRESKALLGLPEVSPGQS